MGVNSDGEHPRETVKKRKITPSEKKLGELSQEKYSIYTKPGYKRLFPTSRSGDCVVYVESTENKKVGNRNPISVTNLFTQNVKGIVAVHRVNAHKIGITFRKPEPANSFLSMDDFLMKYKLRAFIPAYMTEKTGVLRFVPRDMSNEDIYKNLCSDAEVISVKRFMRKVDGKLAPLNTVAVTFATTTLPQYVYINLFRYEVHTYIPPLIQCYKCLKFNHSAKVCRGIQMCSSCAGQHSYKECDVDTIICINCSGNHLAISRECPEKQKKMEEKKKKVYNQNYVTVVSTPPSLNDDKQFPPLPKTIEKQTPKIDFKQIAENDIIINAIIKSLVTLGNNTDNVPLTNKRIREILLSNLV